MPLGRRVTDEKPFTWPQASSSRQASLSVVMTSMMTAQGGAVGGHYPPSCLLGGPGLATLLDPGPW